MNKANLEYVISGTNHFRCSYLTEPSIKYNDDIRGILRDILKKSQGKFGHNYAILFNAFIEESLGKKLHDVLGDSVSNMYSDSGGLQIVTQGKKVTPAIKKKIYQIQSMYSDIGMCFDEIPVRLVNERSDRNDTKNRWFDASLLEEKARATGKNVLEQIDTYLEEKSNTKPAFIVQGNCLDSYQRWCDYALDEIPSSKHKYIQCVAMGAAALGGGEREEALRAMIIPFLPVSELSHHVHLLGIGSYRRLIPYIIAKNSLYDDNMYISYDSSRHAGDCMYGRYHYNDFDSVEVPIHTMNETYQLVFDDMVDKFGKESFLGFEVEDVFYFVNNSNTKVGDKYGERLIKTLFEFMWTMGSILNFTRDVDKLNNKQLLLDSIRHQKSRMIYEHLYQIKTLDDYIYWENEFGKYLNTNRINNHKPSQLDSLFE